MTTDARTRMAECADALAEIAQLLATAVPADRTSQLTLQALQTCLQFQEFRHREWLAEQERSEPVQQPDDVSDSDFAAFEEAEHQQ